MTTNITGIDFSQIDSVNPGGNFLYQYYKAATQDNYNVLVNLGNIVNLNYWVFSLGSPSWDNIDTVDTSVPGTFETGAGDDLLYQDTVSFSVNGQATVRFLGGAGDDAINPLQFTVPSAYGQVEAYGGSGNDAINGSDSADALYGDTADSFTGFPIIASFTAAPYDTGGDGDDAISGYGGDDTVSGDGGDDQLDGGEGADTLTGGDGDDFLFGGPRGAGDLDVLTGGTGSDAFVLSYAQGAADSAGAGFWAGYFEKAGESIAGSIANSVLKDAVKAATDAGILAGFLAGGIGAVGSQLVEAFVGLVEDLLASPPPQNLQDAMVVMDFDPREDVLILPLPATAVEVLDASVVSAEEVPGGGGMPNELALRFRAGGNDYAYVLLSQDFLTDMGLTGTGDATRQVLNNLANFSSTIGGTSGSVGFTRLVSATISQELPDGGFQPQNADLPPGSSLLLYGAIGGAVIANGESGDTYGSVLAGTNFADALSTNPYLVDPAKVTSFGLEGAVIHGFDGDDLVYGTDFADRLFGDDGDDTLYSFVSSLNSDNSVDPESLSGGEGDDVLYGGGTAGSFDGGGGSDTFAVLYGNGEPELQLEVDLTTGQAAERVPPSDSSAPVGDTAPFPFTVENNYTLTGIENAIGGPRNDWIKAAANSLIEGGFGADYLDANAGGVTISYASSIAGVTVQLYNDQAVTGGGDAAGDVIGYGSLLTDIAALTGSANADTLGFDLAVGDNAENQPALTGNGGSDKFQILDLPDTGASGLCTITDFNQTAGEADLIDLSPLGITSISRIVKEQDVYGIAVPPDGDFALLLTLPGFSGTLTTADFALAKAVSGRAVADAGGEGLVGGRGADILLGRGGDDFLFGEGGHDLLRGAGGNDALHGGKGADVLTGGRGIDHLHGDAGNDRLWGGRGDDVIDGGKGADRLGGGCGADTFLLRFAELDGEVVTDFTRADGDRLTVVADRALSVVDQGCGVFLLSDGQREQTVTVKGATVADFLL